MRVGVNIAGGSVGSPTGVPDADVAGNRVGGEKGLEAVDSAGGFDDGELSVGGDGGDAGAVVAAVFEAMKPHQQELGCIAWPNISNDPAHRFLAPLKDQIPRVRLDKTNPSIACPPYWGKVFGA